MRLDQVSPMTHPINDLDVDPDHSLSKYIKLRSMAKASELLSPFKDPQRTRKGTPRGGRPPICIARSHHPTPFFFFFMPSIAGILVCKWVLKQTHGSGFGGLDHNRSTMGAWQAWWILRTPLHSRTNSDATPLVALDACYPKGMIRMGLITGLDQDPFARKVWAVWDNLGIG